jgi:hypothetical protein
MTRKGLFSVILITALIFMSIGVIASPSIKSITANINYDIKMILNGTDYNPIEADGSAIRPIVYNGRTYLPVRALANAFNIPIDWDGNTSTIYLGAKNNIISLSNSNFKGLYSWINFTSDADILYTPNKVFKKGIYTAPDDKLKNMQCYVYPKGKYTKFGGELYAEGSDVNLKLYNNNWNGEVLKEIKVPAGQIINFEVNITNLQTIYIGSDNAVQDKYKLVLGDPYFK